MIPTTHASMTPWIDSLVEFDYNNNNKNIVQDVLPLLSSLHKQGDNLEQQNMLVMRNQRKFIILKRTPNYAYTTINTETANSYL